MGIFRFIQTDITGLVVVEPNVFTDSRGYFTETYCKKDFEESGIIADFVQDNQSFSRKNVIRGLHFQKKNPQVKLVRVLSGAVFDVVVDLRPNSKTFGKWFGIELSSQNRLQLYIPEGFAHGFQTLSDGAEFAYKCTRYYAPEDEGGIRWDDPEIGIAWQLETGGSPILSEKDSRLPCFKDVKQDLCRLSEGV